VTGAATAAPVHLEEVSCEFPRSIEKSANGSYASKGVHFLLHGDHDAAQRFVNTYGSTGGVFIPKALGLDYYGADRISSTDTDYVMDQIRERCINDSSMQIVLIGPCTHSRRYIDWEIKRSLLGGNGLLGILLPPTRVLISRRDFRLITLPTGWDSHNFILIPKAKNS